MEQDTKELLKENLKDKISKLDVKVKESVRYL